MYPLPFGPLAIKKPLMGYMLRGMEVREPATLTLEPHQAALSSCRVDYARQSVGSITGSAQVLPADCVNYGQYRRLRPVYTLGNA
jgi:hypothetical protein